MLHSLPGEDLFDRHCSLFPCTMDLNRWNNPESFGGNKMANPEYFPANLPNPEIFGREIKRAIVPIAITLISNDNKNAS